MPRASVMGGPFGSLLVLACTGCLDELNKPVPPTAPPAVASFAAPSGRLEDVSFAAVLAALEAAAEDYASLCGWDPLGDLACLEDGTCTGCALSDVFFDALRDLLPSLTGEPVDGGVDGLAGVNGFVEMVRLCPGFDAPAPDPAHGRVELTAGFTGRGVDPVTWGTAVGCQLPLAGQPLTVDGSYQFHFADRVPFASIESTPVLFVFEGTVTAGVSTQPAFLAMRGRLDRAGDTELLVDLGTAGTFVFVIAPTGVFVAAADGYFGCSVETETCQSISVP